MNPRNVQHLGPEFLQTIPVVESLADSLLPGRHVELPANWLVAVSDIKASTEAIDRGLYKEVNGVAAAVIASVRNAVRPHELPFAFGGDGATLCVPEESRRAALAGLQAAQAMAHEQFGLELRIGLLSYARILEAGSRIFLSRLRISDNIHQAIFFGGGLDKAEVLLKSGCGQTVAPDAGPEPIQGADFSGIECRWESLPSPHGETISCLFKSRIDDEAHTTQTYQRIFKVLREIYGDEQTMHPFNNTSLQLTLSNRLLNTETGVRSYGSGKSGFWRYRIWLKLQILVGKLIMRYGLRFANADWSHYRRDLIANADYRKLDDVLRMVISSTPEQRQRLEQRLKDEFDPDELAYGLHVSDAALVTCLIDSYEGEHFHFIDGKGGGYAAAARHMKTGEAAT